MGNGIELLTHDVLYRTKFDKRSLEIGILGTAYMGRLLYIAANMVDIVMIVEVGSSDEEDEDSGRCRDRGICQCHEDGPKLQRDELEFESCEDDSSCESDKNDYSNGGTRCFSEDDSNYQVENENS